MSEPVEECEGEHFIGTHEVRQKRRCPYCDQPQFWHITLKEWIHSTGVHAYDCRLLRASEGETR